jgi:endonuclease YncB( thermonuclease family)
MLVTEPQNIEAVLLSDGWHAVHDQSFKVVYCEISARGMRHGEWKNAATWQELDADSEKTVRSITVPFDTVRGIRETRAPDTK